MALTPTLYTGEDASIVIMGSGQSYFGISDFSLSISRGTAEQKLVGEKGSFVLAGSRSVDGSLTGCKLTTDGLGMLVERMIDGQSISISGSTGDNSLHFYFKSCQVKSFNFSIGTADDITDGSIDFTLLYPYKVSSTTQDGKGYTKLWDFA